VGSARLPSPLRLLAPGCREAQTRVVRLLPLLVNRLQLGRLPWTPDSATVGDAVRGLGNAQRSIQNFVTSRLERAADPLAPYWRDISSSMRQDAGNLLEQVTNGMPIQGQVIEVTNVGSAAESIAVSSW